MAGEFASKKAVQAWCKETTKHIPMDAGLCEAFAEIIEELTSQPWLGNATTKQLLDEIAARVDLNYKTVESEDSEEVRSQGYENTIHT